VVRCATLDRGGSGEGQAVEVVGGAIEIVAIDDGCAVGDVGIVIVDYAMVVPVGSPVVPSPAEAAEEADAEAQAEGNAGSGDLQSWIGVPTRPGDDSIGQILTLEFWCSCIQRSARQFLWDTLRRQELGRPKRRGKAQSELLIAAILRATASGLRVLPAQPIGQPG
jgi:hypothetical protein